MQRALCVAIAFAGNPTFIFLDNPTINMDSYMKDLVIKAIEKRKFGKYIFLSTNCMEEAEKLGNKFLVLKDGKFQLYEEFQSFNKEMHLNYNISIDKIYKKINKPNEELQNSPRSEASDSGTESKILLRG